ncbi:unnamed protein product [Phytomonas sp. Hart1]|nr:unnamed protein product [Phytomonas sp. Hart1]|eukprot:CCW66722.1 unnamed protein product [Phytomonas sp. isolate Hart1]
MATSSKTVSAVTSLEILYSRRDVTSLGAATAVGPGVAASYDEDNNNNIDTTTTDTHELDAPLSIPRTTPLHNVLNTVKPPSSRGLKRDKVAWRCGLCGYLMLSLDQEGSPIPLACSAFGTPLPLGCPRCSKTHTNWESASPFDAFGADINLRNAHRLRVGTQGLSKLSSSIPYVTPLPSSVSREEVDLNDPSSKIGRADPSRIPTEGQDGVIASALPDTFCRKTTDVSQKQCYHCERCHRRLLRVDAWGKLIPMNCGADGNVLPILCPGCGVLHSEWTIGPFRH